MPTPRIRDLIFLLALCNPPSPATAQEPGRLRWIWAPGAEPRTSVDSCFFRKVFQTNWPADEATLDITADANFQVWLNGEWVGAGADAKRVFQFPVKPKMRKGRNVVAVQAEHAGPGGGLLVRLGYAPNGQSKTAVLSDATWKASRSAPAGWEKPAFRDETWPAARDLGPYGATPPWKSLVWDAGGDDRFSVPKGFRVELAVPNPNPRDPFSLLNLTFDRNGRLFISQEHGPVWLCTRTNPDGPLTRVRPYCTQLRDCQGMCWVAGALYLVGEGPQGCGVYRVRDTHGRDQADEIHLVLPLVGHMGEHGPHAILLGPDGWLYLVLGNGSWARPERLAANSPLRRWPHGVPGVDQGQPGSTEDILLPRLDEAHGLDPRTLAPGGTIWRMDREGRNLSLVIAGLRNAYDAAFDADGECFTFDSDMEWDEGLPWYRPVRICHCPPGADFLWRDGSANTPAYYLDSLPPVYETGRGSPVGMTFYAGTAFPEKYHGAAFMGDWSLGLIYAVRFHRHGASFQAEVERFCQGTPMNVTDLAVGPEGALYFTMGGRGSQGGVYRIVSDGQHTPRSAPKPASNSKAPHVWQLGIQPGPSAAQELVASLGDPDPFVRRRACESLIRAEIEPPLEALWPLLAEEDRFVRTAARLVLQRSEPARWASRIATDPDRLRVLELIVALCKTDRALPYAELIFKRLGKEIAGSTAPRWLEYLRTLQLALTHCSAPMAELGPIAERCLARFPQGDVPVDRELAIILTHCARHGWQTDAVRARLLVSMQDPQAAPAQQIHSFYCLRLLPSGWTRAEKQAVLAWYERTGVWQGGHSFRLFLENIFREFDTVLNTDDRREFLEHLDRRPHTAALLLRVSPAEQLPAASQLGAWYDRFASRSAEGDARELGEALIEALGRSRSREAHRILRGIAKRQPAELEKIVQALAGQPVADDWPLLVAGLQSSNQALLFDVLDALHRLEGKPREGDAGPFHAVLLAARRLAPRNQSKGIALLRHWTGGRRFGASDDQPAVELAAWERWYAQAFPQGPVLPQATEAKPGASKYGLKELLAYLENDPQGRAGDPERGRAVFARAQCAKCHRYGKEGEAIGPDLTTVSKRFKRADILESILYPSKVISDQYRSTVILTRKGQQITGLAVPQADGMIVLQSDGTKVSLKRPEIEQQFQSLVSVMPERLLDPLTKAEIADLFAYLESIPEP